MTLIKSIAIDNPCVQSWQQMTDTENGRYCRHCQKTVVDFTTMTSADIIGYLSARDRICGRFDAQQLNRLNQSLMFDKKRTLNWKGLGLAALLLGFSHYIKAETSQTVKIEQLPIPNKYKPLADSSKVVKGRIVDDTDGAPMRGVSVRVKGTDKEALTDVNGRFSITTRSNSDTLIAKFIGYDNKEIAVDSLRTPIVEIVLQQKAVSCTVTLGGVIVVKRPFYVRAWDRLKNSVRSIF